MSEMTTVSIFKETRKLLEERKEYPRQSFDELIRKLLGVPPYQAKEPSTSAAQEASP